MEFLHIFLFTFVTLMCLVLPGIIGGTICFWKGPASKASYMRGAAIGGIVAGLAVPLLTLLWQPTGRGVPFWALMFLFFPVIFIPWLVFIGMHVGLLRFASTRVSTEPDSTLVWRYPTVSACGFACLAIVWAVLARLSAPAPIDLDAEANATPAIAAESAFNAQDWQATIKHATEAIKLDPKNALMFKDRGMAYYQTGDYKAAVNDWNDTVRLDPSDTQAIANRGLAKESLNKLPAAIADYQLAWNKSGGTLDWAKGEEAEVYTILERWDDAIAAANEALKVNPKNGFALMQRGMAEGELGRTADAEKDFKTAIALEDSHCSWWVMLSEAQQRLGHVDDAMRSCDKALALDPNDKGALDQKRFLVELKQGRH